MHMNRKEAIREEVLSAVANQNGIKGPDLIVKVMSSRSELFHQFNNTEFFDVINNMIKHGEIIELEYIEPGMEYRIKAMYFKKGTELLNWQGKQINETKAKDNMDTTSG